MTRSEIDRVNIERLTDWAIELAVHHCTAALCVGVGHDEHAGEVHCFVPDGLPDGYIRGLIGELSRVWGNGQ